MKKNIFLLLVLILSFENSFTQSPLHNYTLSSIVRLEGIKDESLVDKSNSNQTIEYIDGLYRVKQIKQIAFTPYQNDLVQPVEYDEYGRQTKEHLFYKASNNLSNFDYDWEVNHQNFYNNPGIYIRSTLYPYSEKSFDNSPLNRITKRGAPGYDWQLDQNPISYRYLTNSIDDDIKIWEYDVTTGHSSSISSYKTGTILITETTDEDQNISKEYKDMFGRTILTTKELSGETLYTYFVYDDFGNIGAVIPPKAFAAMFSSGSFSTSILTEDLVYIYIYDERHRLVEKKIPGQEKIYIVYDKLDRIVLTQDGNLRNENLWNFIKYDRLDRPIIEGLYFDNIHTTREGMQSFANGFVNNTSTFNFEDFNETSYTYSNKSFPNVNMANGKDVYLIYNFYDNYDFINTSTNNYLYYHTPDTDLASDKYIDKPIGQLTGTKVNVLGTSDYLFTSFHYDKYDREIQRIEEHYMDGYDVNYYKFDFTGNTSVAKLEHHFNLNSIAKQHYMKWWYTYDHSGRLLNVEHEIDNQPKQKISEYKYNELGQLIEKNLCKYSDGESDNFAQSIDYRYNERGWLTNINNSELIINTTNNPSDNNTDLFGMDILYNSGFGDLYSTALYNGNISGIKWKIDGPERGYGFKYDEINRLGKAIYGEKGSNSFDQNVNRYSVTGENDGMIEYDENGNIIKLWRQGENSGTSNYSYGYIDKLNYEYEGNKLTAVNDDVPDINFGYYDFADGYSSGYNEYTYDDNGNMTEDKNKNIKGLNGGIPYNFLNLPEELFMSTGDIIRYVYSATGKKLQKKIYLNIDNTTHRLDKTVTYTSFFVYNQNELEYVFFDEGRLLENSGTFEYQYYLKDHLGNTRVTFSEDDGLINMLQQDHYYPFGMSFMGVDASQTTTTNLYKYNGKELQPDFYLNWYDYGARFYDPAIGRWHVVDPLTGEYPNISGYAAMNNNPIIFIDADGRENITVVGSQNNESAGSKLMFVNQGIRALRQWSMSETESGESRSMVFFTGGYSDKQITRIEKSVAKYGGTLVKVNSVEEMINYVNSASTGSGDLSSTRTGDKVTDMEIYAHGVTGSIEFGYKTENADAYRLNSGNVGSLNSGAFDGTNSTITSYTCRTALGNDIKYVGNSYMMNTSNSLAQKMSNATGAHVAAFPVRTDYQFTLGTWSERRFAFPNAAPTIQMVGGAAFTPNGALHPVKAGSTPLFLYQGKLNFYPRK